MNAKERYGFLTDIRSVYRVGVLGAVWILLSKRKRYRRISEVAESITHGRVRIGVGRVLEEFISQVRRQLQHKEEAKRNILCLVRYLSICPNPDIRYFVRKLAEIYPGEMLEFVEAIQTGASKRYLDMLELRGTLLWDTNREAGAREFLHVAMIMLNDRDTLYKMRICHKDSWAALEIEPTLACVHSWLKKAKLFYEGREPPGSTAIDQMIADVLNIFTETRWAKEVPRWEALLESAHND